jgi:hypothetical protein
LSHLLDYVLSMKMTLISRVKRRGPKPKKTRQEIRKAILRTQSFTEAAEALGMTKQRVHQIAQEMGLKTAIIGPVMTPENN